jgi:hypothetical protein
MSVKDLKLDLESNEPNLQALKHLSDCIEDAVRKAYETGWNDHAEFVAKPQHEKVNDGSLTKVPFLEAWDKYEDRNK